MYIGMYPQKRWYIKQLQVSTQMKVPSPKELLFVCRSLRNHKQKDKSLFGVRESSVMWVHTQKHPYIPVTSLFVARRSYIERAVHYACGLNKNVTLKKLIRIIFGLWFSSICGLMFAVCCPRKWGNTCICEFVIEFLGILVQWDCYPLCWFLIFIYFHIFFGFVSCIQPIYQLIYLDVSWCIFQSIFRQWDIFLIV